MALLSWGMFQKFFLTPQFAIYFVFCAALLTIIFIDFYHQIIPDAITLSGIVVGFACSFVNADVGWQASAIGILAGGGSFYLIAATYYLLTKREGMGGGDIKLLAMIGAFLGWTALPFVVFSSSFIGTVAGIGAMLKQKKGGKTVIPYGPFLAIGSILYLFFREDIQHFYEILLIR